MAVVLLALVPAAAGSDVDPRLGLTAGWLDAGSASSGMELLAHNDRPAGLLRPGEHRLVSFANSDLAFSGNHAFVGNFNGFNIYDIENPAAPKLMASVVCPGGQGDVSVYGNLLFMSVEQTRGRIDCGTQGVTGRSARSASAASASSTSATSRSRSRSRRCRPAAARTRTRS